MTYEQLIVTPIGSILMRQAQYSDLNHVIDILEEAAQWQASRGIDQWQPGEFKESLFQAALANRIEQGLVYLAQQEGIVCGTITLQWTDPIDMKLWKNCGRSDDAGYIHKLVIRRAWAGHELGQCLLQWAEKTISEMGKTAVRLDCMAENYALRTYYERAGFICRGEMQGKGWKARLYEKQLEHQ